jgi:putative sterol carrier protein
MEEINTEIIMAKVAGKISKGSIAGINGTLQLELTGDKSAIWHVDIKDENYTVVEGAAESPTLTLSCDSNVLADLIDGRLDIVQSYMTGKLKISGDLALAMRLAGSL